MRAARGLRRTDEAHSQDKARDRLDDLVRKGAASRIRVLLGEHSRSENLNLRGAGCCAPFEETDPRGVTPPHRGMVDVDDVAAPGNLARLVALCLYRLSELF